MLVIKICITFYISTSITTKIQNNKVDDKISQVYLKSVYMFLVIMKMSYLMCIWT